MTIGHILTAVHDQRRLLPVRIRAEALDIPQPQFARRKLSNKMEVIMGKQDRAELKEVYPVHERVRKISYIKSREEYEKL